MARLLPMAMCAMVGLAAVKAAALVAATTPSARADAPAAPPAPALATTPNAPAASPPTGAGAGLPNAAAAATVVVAAPPEPGVGPDERALLLDLRKRRAELDAREAGLVTREGSFAAAQARLTTRMDELDALRHRLEALEAARRDRDEASWRGLVRTYEAMRPKDAAAIFDDLEMPVLLQVVDRMREAKAALVLSAMLPDRARALTTELVKLRARANAEPANLAAATNPAPTKGVP